MHSGPLAERFRDTEFEDRVEADILLDRFERYAATTAHGAKLARALQLFYEGHAGTEVARQVQLDHKQLMTARRELRDKYRALTKAS